MSGEYRRAKDGKTIHRADCSRAKTALPWDYAKGFTANQILNQCIVYTWLVPCHVCKPDKEP